MRSRVNERFRKAFESLPEQIQRKARETYARWHDNQAHPSLQYKKIHATQPIYSVRTRSTIALSRNCVARADQSKSGSEPNKRKIGL